LVHEIAGSRIAFSNPTDIEVSGQVSDQSISRARRAGPAEDCPSSPHSFRMRSARHSCVPGATTIGEAKTHGHSDRHNGKVTGFFSS
jgi:hypothetical protein